jgi:hypothetical protein
MSRKRKGHDEVVARIFQAHPTPLLFDRTVSVYMTVTGRLSQSTSFLPSSMGPASEADLGDPGPSSTLNTETGSNNFASNNFALDEDLASRAAKENQSEGFADWGDTVEDIDADDSPLREWANIHRETYLDEMMRHKGCAGAHHCSGQCGGDGMFKCKDCFSYQLWCRNCFVKQHSHLPLHRLLVW